MDRGGFPQQCRQHLVRRGDIPADHGYEGLVSQDLDLIFLPETPYSIVGSGFSYLQDNVER